MNLDAALARAGCPTDAETFRRLVLNWWRALHKGRTLREFLTSPADVAEFCAVMRGVFVGLMITDDVFIRALRQARRGQARAVRVDGTAA